MREGMVALVGCVPVEAAAGLVVEDVGGVVDAVSGAAGGEVGAAWEPVADEPVGVFVESALLGCVGVAEPHVEHPYCDP